MRYYKKKQNKEKPTGSKLPSEAEPTLKLQPGESFQLVVFLVIWETIGRILQTVKSDGLPLEAPVQVQATKNVLREMSGAVIGKGWWTSISSAADPLTVYEVL